MNPATQRQALERPRRRICYVDCQPVVYVRCRFVPVALRRTKRTDPRLARRLRELKEGEA